MYQPNYPYGQNQGITPYNQPRHPRRRSGCIGCIAWLVFLLLMAGGGRLVYLYIQNNPSSVSFLSDFFSSNTFNIMGLIGIVLIIIVMTLANVLRRTVLGKLLGGLAGIMVGVVVVLLWMTFLNPHIGMTRTNFTTTYVSIFSRNKVTFGNPSNGVTQILCVGTDQQCETYQPTLADYPSQFAHGLVIQPGQSVSVEFDHAGSYYLTSKNTPHMNLKVVVTGPNKKGGDY